jgi:hypothetical protein
MTPRNALLFCTVLSAIPLLSACEQTKERLGLTRRTPDEFAIVKHAPLEVPQDLSSLPAPRPGAPRPQEQNPGDVAKNTLIGPDQPLLTAPSAAETGLLAKTGGASVSPSIRAQIDREAAEEKEDVRPVVTRMLDFGKSDAQEPAVIVDAPAELKRIQTNKQTGQPVTSGETPTLDN